MLYYCSRARVKLLFFLCFIVDSKNHYLICKVFLLQYVLSLIISLSIFYFFRSTQKISAQIISSTHNSIKTNIEMFSMNVDKTKV